MTKILLSLFILSLSLPAFAESTAEFLIRQYDDGETQVTTPHAEGTTTINKDQVTLGIGYAMDIVTSSSCDVRSWSSSGKISDSRREESGNVTFNLPSGSLGVGYVRSDENDYHSDTYSLGTSKDFFDKNTTLDLAVTYGVNHVQNSKDPNFDKLLYSEGISAGLTQVFTPLDIGQLLYDFSIESGYLSGSYRVARLVQSDGSVVGIPENSPTTRNRHAFAAKYNHYFKKISSSVASTLRYYLDSWAISSITLEERLSHDFSKKFSISLNVRYYTQGQANFYQDKYNPASLPAFFTGNKTLSNYYSASVGVRPTIQFGKEWSAYAKMEYYLENFTNFTDVGNPVDPTDDKLYVLHALIYGAGVSGKF